MDQFGSFVANNMHSKVLERDEERELVRRAQAGDSSARTRLFDAYFRIVPSVAKKYIGNGIPWDDLLSQGMIGLIKAIDRIDPERENRIKTYALHWIRAEIGEYVLKGRFMVNVITTADRKTAFFNINRAMKKLGIFEMNPETASQIAEYLDIPVKDVMEIHRVLNEPEVRLDKKVGEDDDSASMMDFLGDPTDREEEIIERDEHDHRMKLVREALAELTDRERDIFVKRKLTEDGPSLEDLGEVYKVSRERVRQIENNALRKVKSIIHARDPSAGVMFEDAA